MALDAVVRDYPLPNNDSSLFTKPLRRKWALSTKNTGSFPVHSHYHLPDAQSVFCMAVTYIEIVS